MGLNQIGGIARSGSTAWENGQQISVPPSSGYPIPSGNFYVVLGPYTSVQYFDSLANMWRAFQTGPTSDPVLVSSDGTNYRVKNDSGCCMAGVITGAGSGMNNGVYSTSLGSGLAAAAGNSLTFAETTGTPTRRGTYNLVIGGAISTTVTVTTAGSGYLAFPILQASDPPAGGVRATAVVTALTAAGGISTVSVTNQGAGYTVVPTWTIIPASGDASAPGTAVPGVLAGSGAVLTSTLTGSGTLTAMYATDPGANYAVVPTFTFTGGGTPTATAVMCMAALTVSTQGAGTGLTNGTYPAIIGSAVTAGSAIYTNTSVSTGLFTPQFGTGTCVVTGGTTATYTILTGGLHQTLPVIGAVYMGVVTTLSQLPVLTMGGANDLIWLVPA